MTRKMEYEVCGRQEDMPDKSRYHLFKCKLCGKVVPFHGRGSHWYQMHVKRADYTTATNTSVSQFTVYDEMACEVLLKTTDEKEARDKAYNHQCMLFKDGRILHDYSCDW